MASSSERVRRWSDFDRQWLGVLTSLDGMFGRADVVNLSIGARGRLDLLDPIQIAFDELVASGVPVVVAAGNYGPDDQSLQRYARGPSVISVAALTADRVLLRSSSRGGEGMWGPTFASDGQNQFIPTEQGTSFASPRVARAALFAKKCLELLISDLRVTVNGAQPEYSQPIALPRLGFIDRGFGEIETFRGPVAKQLIEQEAMLRVGWTDRMYVWLAQFAEATHRSPIPDLGSATVLGALIEAAVPLQYPRETIGHGYVDLNTVVEMFGTLTVSRVCRLLGVEVPLEAARFDDALGPFWDADRMSLLADVFGTGALLELASVG